MELLLCNVHCTLRINIISADEFLYETTSSAYKERPCALHPPAGSRQAGGAELWSCEISPRRVIIQTAHHYPDQQKLHKCNSDPNFT